MEQYPKIYLYRRIVQAKRFIDEHFNDNIDLDNIADEAYFSKFHFIRLFKNIYDKTPHQYLTYVRIEKAKLLLAEDIPVAEVCFSVGLNSASSFTGLFKRIVGLTPSAFQQNQLKRKTAITLMPLKFIPNCFAENKGWTKNSNF
ncbi:MAG: AraC family transcriptional regulator [Ferruginibacter sp.]